MQADWQEIADEVQEELQAQSQNKKLRLPQTPERPVDQDEREKLLPGPAPQHDE